MKKITIKGKEYTEDEIQFALTLREIVKWVIALTIVFYILKWFTIIGFF